LRGFLGATLPHYMIPSRFVFLDAMPLTVNGKLDRRSLPSPGHNPVDRETSASPDNETEAAIAAAFVDELGIDQVSRDANFFDLGAHSMCIVRVHRRLSQQHEMDVSIVSFYTFPTVATLAAHIAGPSDEPLQATRQEATGRADLRKRARRRRRGRSQGQSNE
jgi:acyl carrier protein